MAFSDVPAPAVLVLAAWLAGCAGGPAPAGGGTSPDPAMLSAIKAYYEHNASEQNNICKGPLMDGVTRSEVVSRDANQTVVQVGYKYSDYTSRTAPRRSCSGFGDRTFTLARSGGRYRVVEMSGAYRTGPSIRLW